MWSNILPLKRTKTYLCQWLKLCNTVFSLCRTNFCVCDVVPAGDEALLSVCLCAALLHCKTHALRRLLLVVTPKKTKQKKTTLIMWTVTYHDCGSSPTRFSSYKKKKWNHVVNHTWGLSFCINRLCFRVLWHIRHAMKTVSPHFFAPRRQRRWNYVMFFMALSSIFFFFSLCCGRRPSCLLMPTVGQYAFLSLRVCPQSHGNVWERTLKFNFTIEEADEEKRGKRFCFAKVFGHMSQGNKYFNYPQ